MNINDYFLQLIEPYLEKYLCHPIKVYKITEQIFYVLYYSKRNDSTIYGHFSFIDGEIKAIKLERIKEF